MVMVNKKLIIYKMSRFFSLLILLNLFSCNSKKNKDLNLKVLFDNDSRESRTAVNDSLEVIIHNIPSNIYTVINSINSNLKNISLEFHNKDSISKSISNKLKVPDSDVLLLSFRSFSLINNVHKSYWYMIAIENNIKLIEFDYERGDIKLLTSDNGIKYVQDIRKGYSEIDFEYNKNKISKDLFIKKIEKRYVENDLRFNKNNDLLRIRYNELEFLNSLSRVDTKDKRIFDYFTKINKPIYCQAYKNIIYNYVNSDFKNIYKINYNDITDEFKKILAIELTEHLVNYKGKEYNTYKDNLAWLKQTNYYRENNIEIENSLKTEDKNVFSKKLMLFDIYDNLENKLNLQKVVEKGKHEFYLIDFWASWCAPCILDINTLHELSLPNNIGIINISLDKTREKEKWYLKKKELNIENSYLFIETESNKNFINLIALNQIPRYILIDKKFNIIDLDFIRPSEKNFSNEILRLTKKIE